MAKPFKIFLWVVGGLLALLVGAVLAVPLFFDPNDYRDDIARGVQEATGRELTISGDLSLKLFPWLAIGVGQTRLSNAPGFGEAPMLQFENLEAGLRLMPLLLAREIRIGTVRAEGLVARLATNEAGVNNWDDLVKPKEEAPQQPKKEGRVDLQSIQIGGIDIDNASVIYSNRATNKEYRAENLNLETGALKPGQPIDVLFTGLVTATNPDTAADLRLQATVVPDVEQQVYELKTLEMQMEARGAPVPAGKQSVNLQAQNLRYDQGQGVLAAPQFHLQVAGLTMVGSAAAQALGTEAPTFSGKLTAENINVRQLAKDLGVDLPPTADENVLKSASLRANYEGDTKALRLTDVVAKLDETNVSGTVAVTDFSRQAIEFALKVDRFDADRYLEPAAEPAAKGAPQAKTDINAVEVPVALLDKFNAAGTVGIGWLKVKNLKFTDVALKLKAVQGQPKTFELASKFYGGRIQHSGRITPGTRPSYDVRATLESVNAAPVQQDFLGKALVSGTGGFTLAVNSSGVKIGDIRKALDGTMRFGFADGAVKGFNLAEQIRKSRALLRREPYTAPAQAAETDFAAFTGSARIVNGVLKTDDVSAKSPLFRFAGNGTVDLVAEQVSFLAKPTIVETLKGQGGAGLEELRGVTIPIRVSGSLLDPKVKFDWDAIIKDKAKARIETEKQEAREKIERKLEDKLQDFLKPRRSEPKPAPAPSGTEPAPGEQPSPAPEPAPAS